MSTNNNETQQHHINILCANIHVYVYMYIMCIHTGGSPTSTRPCQAPTRRRAAGARALLQQRYGQRKRGLSKSDTNHHFLQK